MKLQFNIGLLKGKSGEAYPIGEAVATIAYYFNATPFRSEEQIAESGEHTCVIELETAVYPLSVMDAVCKVLGQDCIAFMLLTQGPTLTRKQGFLVGPNTAPYGGRFNPQYWLNPSCEK